MLYERRWLISFMAFVLMTQTYKRLLTLWKFVAENDTEKSQLLWNLISQKEMLHWKFFSAI